MRASVDREGNLLRLEGPAAGRDLAADVERTLSKLGYSAQPLSDPPIVTRWFGAGETDELSQEEASVLAERWIDELATAIEEPERLREPLRSVLDENEVSIVQRWLRRKLRRSEAD